MWSGTTNGSGKSATACLRTIVRISGVRKQKSDEKLNGGGYASLGERVRKSDSGRTKRKRANSARKRRSGNKERRTSWAIESDGRVLESRTFRERTNKRGKRANEDKLGKRG